MRKYRNSIDYATKHFNHTCIVFNCLKLDANETPAIISCYTDDIY